MDLVSSVLRLAACLIYLVNGVRITNMQMPTVIQNATRSSVVLDCQFRYEQFEVHSLEVKWFFNFDPEPVYQWIPGEKPEAFGIFKNRVNLRFRASKNRYSMHRALEVLRPTTELTGNYTCRVSSFHSEDWATKSVIVFAPVRNMSLEFTMRRRKSLRLTCEAYGVFPKPELVLRLHHRGAVEDIPADNFSATEDPGTGSFSTALTVTVTKEEGYLMEESLFDCTLSIPETRYRVRRRLIYYPGYHVEDILFLSGVGREASSALLIFLLPLLTL